ncbi:MAG: response regulator [Cyanobacteria bacterium J06621_11]
MSGSIIVDNLHKIIESAYEQKLTGMAKVSAQLSRWQIYFIFGRIVWISDRTHPLRRWKRHLTICSPALAKQIENRPDLPQTTWNYTALAKLAKAKKFPQNQLSNIIESVVTENLFDILQVSTLQAQHAQQDIQPAAATGQGLRYEFIPKALTSLPFVTTNHERAWREAQESWQSWTKAELTHILPGWGLTISDFDKLRVRTSPQTLKTIRACCSGQYTLRDLAIAFRQPAIFFTKSMLPYLTEKMVALTEVPDLVEGFSHGFPAELSSDIPTGDSPTGDSLTSTANQPTQPLTHNLAGNVQPSQSTSPHAETQPSPANSPQHQPVSQPISQPAAQAINQPSHQLVSRITPRKSTKNANSGQSLAHDSAPKIIYIDDSPIDSRTMGEIVEKLGYRYHNISDPIQALPLLLEAKPDLIFLDLVMPVANGYEICSQIRRISAFQKTPVIIVTSNDGVADRVRAKLVGASGFLGKPIREKKVARALRKHLRGRRRDRESIRLNQAQDIRHKQSVLAQNSSQQSAEAGQFATQSVEARSKDVLFSR